MANNHIIETEGVDEMSIKSKLDWDWVLLRAIGHSKLSKLTVVVPVLGYFILFNLNTRQYLIVFSDTTIWKVYCLYYGLTLVSIGWVLYFWKCPEDIKIYGTKEDYVVRHSDIVKYEPYKLILMISEVLNVKYKTFITESTQTFLDSYLEFKGGRLVFKNNDGEGVITESKLAYKLRQDYSKEPLININSTYYFHLKNKEPKTRFISSIVYTIAFILLAFPTVITLFQSVGSMLR